VEPDVVLLSRLQFAFTVSFHIIFPSFTIGLAAWLTVLEGMHLYTRREVYRQVFDLWLKIFAVTFAMGVVSGIVMAFQFGTNWSELSYRSGPIMGPLLAYEAFTAFMLEASFLGIMLLGRDRVPPWFYFVSCCLVAIGTSFSAFWILVNNSWMQVPTGYAVDNGRYVPTDWSEILFNWVPIVRFVHMFLAAYLTTAFVVAGVGAWYLLTARSREPARVMVSMGLGLASVLIPIQLIIGHLTGTEVNDNQPIKLAAIEARWETEQPASLVLLAWPDVDLERNLYAVVIPDIGGLVDADNYDAVMPGLKTWPASERPPILIPFFGFRIMVGMGVIMLVVSWWGMLKLRSGRLFTTRWFLWMTVATIPIGWVAVLAGWFVAEVGRQPWTVYKLLQTVQSHSPIGEAEVLLTLVAFLLTYSFIFGCGGFYILRLIRQGPHPDVEPRAELATAGRRPLSLGDELDEPERLHSE
jgi:cytochrome d ubiquinol oxidase subunit I